MAACSVHIAVDLQRASKATADMAQFQAYLVEGLQLFAPKEPRQRVLWPSYVELNQRFFESMLKHAVPLDPRASRPRLACRAGVLGQPPDPGTRRVLRFRRRSVVRGRRARTPAILD